MSAATLDRPTPAQPAAAQSTGPKTTQGKAVASRNAVTHGLHSHDVVLPHLGENQEEFNALHDALALELSPHTAVEQHYVTQMAQAMWRLRRLTRWEQCLYDDPALTDEERIGKMSRVLRYDATLRRHIDRALKALADTPAKQNCQNEPHGCTGMAEECRAWHAMPLLLRLHAQIVKTNPPPPQPILSRRGLPGCQCLR